MPDDPESLSPETNEVEMRELPCDIDSTYPESKEEEMKELVIDIVPPSSEPDEEETLEMFYEKIKYGSSGKKSKDIKWLRMIVKKYPHYCTTRGECEWGRYPIWSALISGRKDMMHFFIKVCPESLHHTSSDGESMVHYALRQEKWECFDLLCKKLHSRNEHHLLDTEHWVFEALQIGKTYRDIAVQRGILKPLDKGGRHITWTILEVSEGNFTRTWSDQTLSLLLTVLVLIAGAAYVDVFPILAAKQVKIVNISIVEVFTYPSSTSEGFHFLITVTIIFLSSMGGILLAVCLICRKRAWVSVERKQAW